MNVIAVVSATGGAGRTTVCGSLAVLLARRRHEVVALELDNQNVLSVYLGLDALPGRGLVQALLDGRSAWHAQTFRSAEGVLFVPHGALDGEQASACDARLATMPCWLRSVLADIDVQGDGVVMLDTARYPSALTMQAVRCADLVLYVSTPDPAAAVSLGAVLAPIRRCAAALHVVVNRVNPAHPMQADVLALLRVKVGEATLLPQRLHLDAAVPDAFARGAWVFDDAPSSQMSHDLHGLAKWLDEWLVARAGGN